MSADFTPLTQKAWYLVYTKPRQESLALENLNRQGYEGYLPRMRLIRQKRGRRVGVIEPLFPRYVFVRLDSQLDNWSPIRSTTGVVSLVRFGNEPAKVPADFVAHLQSLEGEEGVHEWAEPILSIGDRIRVMEGPLKNYEGMLFAKSGQERVVLLLDILGKEVRAHLAVSQIEPIGQ